MNVALAPEHVYSKTSYKTNFKFELNMITGQWYMRFFNIIEQEKN